MENPLYIQIVDCGQYEFAVWSYPNANAFYPIHGKEEDCIQWAINNGYELSAAQNNKTIWKHVKKTEQK